jgi:hypothetical protein
MKKLTVFVLMINVFVLIISCGSMGSTQQNTSRTNSNMRLLNPDDLFGKNLVGSDENGSYRLTLKQDGSFEYSKDESVYVGTWKFYKSARMYRYTFTWDEGDVKQGYIMDFLANGAEITWAGHWYLTDASKSFDKKFAFEE